MKNKTENTRVFTIREILDIKHKTQTKHGQDTGNGRCKPPHTKTLIHNTTTDKHGVPPTKRLFKVAMLDPSLNLLVHGERLEIWDYQLCAIWKNLGYSEWSTPAGLKLARENLQSRVKEEDSITDVENAVFDLKEFSL
ncbi:hypothetical protein Tco_1411090 [Tanacetum coccineum]